MPVYDEEGEQADKMFYVFIDEVEGGAVSGQAETAVRIVDSDFVLPQVIYSSRVFQMLVTLATLFALFGNDACIILLDSRSDEIVSHITLGCFVVFVSEMILVSLLKPKQYIGSIMFWMDLIASLALLPAMKWFAVATNGIFSGAGATGTIARAGRAARAGARAGRTTKISKLLGKLVDSAISFGLKMAERKKFKQRAALKASNEKELRRALEEKNEAAALEAQALLAGIEEEEEEEAKAKAKAAAGGGSIAPSPSKVASALMELFTGKVIVMMMLLLVLVSVLILLPDNPQELGLRQLEQVYASLAPAAGAPLMPPTGAETEEVLRAMETAAFAVFNTPAFRTTMAVLLEGGSPEEFNGAAYASLQQVAYAKVYGFVLPRFNVSACPRLVRRDESAATAEVDHTACPFVSLDHYALASVRPAFEQPNELYYNDAQVYDLLRFEEQTYAEGLMRAAPRSGDSAPTFGCSSDYDQAIEGHLRVECHTTLLLDNRGGYHYESLSSIYLTCAIVFILGLGMGLIAADLQNMLIDPVGRITAVFKKLAEVAKEVVPSSDGGGDDDDDAGGESSSAKLKKAKTPSDPIEYLDNVKNQTLVVLQKLQTVFSAEKPMELFLTIIDDLEAAFGIRLAKQKRAIGVIDEDLRNRMEAFGAIREMQLKGTLTSPVFAQEWEAVTRDWTVPLENLVPSEARGSPLHAAAVSVARTGQGVFFSLLGAIESAMRTMIVSSGVPVKGDLTVGDVSEWRTRQFRKAVEKALSEPPVGLHGMSESDIRALLERALKEKVKSKLLEYGVEVDDAMLVGNIFDIKRRAEAKALEAALAKLPEAARSKLPRAVLRARTFVGMKRAADMHAREEVLRVLRSVRPDLRAMKAGDFASLAELLDLAKQTVLQVTAPLMPDVDRAVATADVVALVASARRLREATAEEFAAMLEKAGYPDALRAYVPDLDALPSLAELRVDASRKAEVAKALRRPAVAARAAKNVNAALLSAKARLSALREVVALLPGVETLRTLDRDELLELVGRLRLGETLKAFVPAESLAALSPPAEAPSREELLAVLERAADAVQQAKAKLGGAKDGGILQLLDASPLAGVKLPQIGQVLAAASPVVVGLQEKLVAGVRMGLEACEEQVPPDLETMELAAVLSLAGAVVQRRVIAALEDLQLPLPESMKASAMERLKGLQKSVAMLSSSGSELAAGGGLLGGGGLDLQALAKSPTAAKGKLGALVEPVMESIKGAFVRKLLPHVVSSGIPMPEHIVLSEDMSFDELRQLLEHTAGHVTRGALAASGIEVPEGVSMAAMRERLGGVRKRAADLAGRAEELSARAFGGQLAAKAAATASLEGLADAVAALRTLPSPEAVAAMQPAQLKQAAEALAATGYPERLAVALGISLPSAQELGSSAALFRETLLRAGAAARARAAELRNNQGRAVVGALSQALSRLPARATLETMDATRAAGVLRAAGYPDSFAPFLAGGGALPSLAAIEAGEAGALKTAAEAVMGTRVRQAVSRASRTLDEANKAMHEALSGGLAGDMAALREAASKSDVNLGAAADKARAAGQALKGAGGADAAVLAGRAKGALGGAVDGLRAGAGGAMDAAAKLRGSEAAQKLGGAGAAAAEQGSALLQKLMTSPSGELLMSLLSDPASFQSKIKELMTEWLEKMANLAPGKLDELKAIRERVGGVVGEAVGGAREAIGGAMPNMPRVPGVTQAKAFAKGAIDGVTARAADDFFWSPPKESLAGLRDGLAGKAEKLRQGVKGAAATASAASARRDPATAARVLDAALNDLDGFWASAPAEPASTSPSPAAAVLPETGAPEAAADDNAAAAATFAPREATASPALEERAATAVPTPAASGTPPPPPQAAVLELELEEVDDD